jgi:hypothetical protein
VISNTLVRRAVQLEYSLLRTPLAVVKRNLTSRLSKDSKVRVGVERGLGTLDAVAGQLLSPPSTDRPSTDRPSASGAERAKSRAAADVPADGNVEPTHDEVELSHEDEVSRVVDEIREELEQKPVTGELADPELQEVQAELRAKHLVEEHEEEQRIKREHEERVRIAEAARKAPARKSTATKAVAQPAKNAAAKKTPGAR